MTNGSLDGHSSLDNNNFPNLPTTNSGISTSSFLSNNNLNDLSSSSSSNTGVIGQLSDHHTLRYLISSSNQQTIQTNRVPLTQAETRMLNRLNSAFAKLPSLLESERQRFFFSSYYINKKFRFFFCFLKEQMLIVFMDEIHLDIHKLFHIIRKHHQRVVIHQNFIIVWHLIHYFLFFIIWR